LVDKQVLAALFGGDETVPLGYVEPGGVRRKKGKRKEGRKYESGLVNGYKEERRRRGQRHVVVGNDSVAARRREKAGERRRLYRERGGSRRGGSRPHHLTVPWLFAAAAMTDLLLPAVRKGTGG
jgi:hypothetical protein